MFCNSSALWSVIIWPMIFILKKVVRTNGELLKLLINSFNLNNLEVPVEKMQKIEGGGLKLLRENIQNSTNLVEFS